MPLILDIETVPLAAAMDAPYPKDDRNPPANYKSDEAIAKWRATDAQKWADERAKECSLNPRLGRVLCIGLAVSDTSGLFMAQEEAFEADVLRSFWEAVAEADGQVVTWNGSWDLRFILMRSLYHGLTPSVPGTVISAWFKKYTTAPHFDCKAVLLNWDVRISGEGLDQWAQFFGVPGKLGGISGADVYPLYLAGHYDEIGEYCAQDVAATAAIYERIKGVYG